MNKWITNPAEWNSLEVVQTEVHDSWKLLLGFDFLVLKVACISYQRSRWNWLISCLAQYCHTYNKLQGPCNQWSYCLHGSFFQLKSIFSELKGNLNHSNNSEIAAAEGRKSELLIVKKNVDRDLSLNYQLREQLRRQLLSLLINQNPQREWER